VLPVTPKPIKEDLTMTTFASPANKTLIWDLPTRIGHWLLAGCVAGAWLTSESERLAVLHAAFGYTIALVVGFRLIWGFVGSRYARWQDFFPSPSGLRRYLWSILQAKPEHHTGHNPLGAVGIVLMIAMLSTIVATGVLSQLELGGHWISEIHEAFAEGLLIVIGLHVSGVLLSSILHRENLIKSMMTGTKNEPHTLAIPRNHQWLGYALTIAAGSCFVYLLRHPIA
jgi:cytochrome b